MSSDERIAVHVGRADVALRELESARTDAERLAAARALESAACQIRRALRRTAVENVHVVTGPNRHVVAAATSLGDVPIGSYDHGYDDAAADE